jgi:hypothetical protein
MEIVQQRSQSAVRRRKQLVFEVGEHRLVRIPRLVVAEVYLHQTDASFDQPAGQEERPTKLIASVTVLNLWVGAGDIESASRADMRQ